MGWGAGTRRRRGACGFCDAPLVHESMHLGAAGGGDDECALMVAATRRAGRVVQMNCGERVMRLQGRERRRFGILAERSSVCAPHMSSSSSVLHVWSYVCGE